MAERLFSIAGYQEELYYEDTVESPIFVENEPDDSVMMSRTLAGTPGWFTPQPIGSSSSIVSPTGSWADNRVVRWHTNGPAAVIQSSPVTIADDGDVSGVDNLSAVSITLTTPLALSSGGSNKALTASNGGLVYTDSDSMEVLAGTATAGQVPRSGANSAPSWSTAVYPNTTTSGRILFSTANNVIGDSGNLTFGSNTLATINIDITGTFACDGIATLGDSVGIATGVVNNRAGSGARSVTISGGTFAVTYQDYQLLVSPETGTADTLDTITGGQNGQHLLIRAAGSSDVITLTENFAGTGKFRNGTGGNIAVSGANAATYHYIYNSAANAWIRIL